MAKILVVDDSANLTSALLTLLREAGHSVTSTNNGADALAILGSHPKPDLLILDMKMPGHSGLDVLRELGVDGPAVIAMSGDPDMLRQLSGGGRVKRVVTKPLDPRTFMAAVEDVLDCCA